MPQGTFQCACVRGRCGQCVEHRCRGCQAAIADKHGDPLEPFLGTRFSPPFHPPFQLPHPLCQSPLVSQLLFTPRFSLTLTSVGAWPMSPEVGQHLLPQSFRDAGLTGGPGTVGAWRPVCCPSSSYRSSVGAALAIFTYLCVVVTLAHCWACHRSSVSHLWASAPKVSEKGRRKAETSVLPIFPKCSVPHIQ